MAMTVVLFCMAIFIGGIGFILIGISEELKEANRLKKLELQYRNKETIPISEIHQI